MHYKYLTIWHITIYKNTGQTTSGRRRGWECDDDQKRSSLFEVKKGDIMS